MNEMIFHPQEEYDKTLRAEHEKNAIARFEELSARSGVDAEANRKTVARYRLHTDKIKSLRRKRNWLRFFRVLMILTILLIPIVIWKMTPKIRALKEEIEQADAKAAEAMREALAQMAPLNALFREQDAIELIEKTLPEMDFEPQLTILQEEDMKANFDYALTAHPEESTLDLLAGHYRGNPFVFENRLVHRMGTETYHGTKTIHWTESYRDSDGRSRTRMRSETLHASVTKPKPFYHTQVVLHYGAQAAPDLFFTRDATGLDEKSEGSLRRYVRRGEKRLRKKEEKALKKNAAFTAMSNSEFEVLFDALDRNDEVQFRTLFTPLAQTNMVDLILSKTAFGDDFHFIKKKRINRIHTEHSQGRALRLMPSEYHSYSYDEIRTSFIEKNKQYFAAVYFDFAPILAIPAYQERPVHSLDPLPDYTRLYAEKESEALANLAPKNVIAHPDSQTPVILKTEFLGREGEMDRVRITADSYRIFPRIETVSVHGGDGHWHEVPVHWDEYDPLQWQTQHHVAKNSASTNALSQRSGLCLLFAQETI